LGLPQWKDHRHNEKKGGERKERSPIGQDREDHQKATNLEEGGQSGEVQSAGMKKKQKGVGVRGYWVAAKELGAALNLRDSLEVRRENFSKKRKSVAQTKGTKQKKGNRVVFRYTNNMRRRKRSNSLMGKRGGGGGDSKVK